MTRKNSYGYMHIGQIGEHLTGSAIRGRDGEDGYLEVVENMSYKVVYPREEKRRIVGTVRFAGPGAAGSS